MNLYFDNASTTFPKPKIVIESINNYITYIGASASRSIYKQSVEANKILFECREILCEFFNYKKSKNLVFTYNATYAINLILNSIFSNNLKKPHVLTSVLEHDSVLKPLLHYEKQNKITLDFIESINGILNIEDMINKTKENTHFIIVSHMCNTTGNIQDIYKISKFCSENNIHLIIDAAQSSGTVNIDLSKIKFSAFCFSGHKSLFATQGIGGFIIEDSLLDICSNNFLGGTGSFSNNSNNKMMPDYFEVGTQNMVGIVSLLSGIKFINKNDINYIFEHKKNLSLHFFNELKNIDNLIFYGDISNSEYHNSIVSFNFKNKDPAFCSYILDKDFSISVRGGIHCSSISHKHFKTYPNGSIRFSFGFFNTIKDVNYAIDSIYKLNKYTNL